MDPTTATAEANPLDELDDSPNQAAFEHNRGYAAQSAKGYQTELAPQEQQKFDQWVKDNHVPYDSSPTADYDMRGFWKGLQSGDPHAKTGINPNDHALHYSDYWKTPYHKSFSRESQYATQDAPSWNEKDQLVDRSGKVVYDERAGQEANPLDAMDDQPAAANTSSSMRSALEQTGDQLPEVTVSARRGPEATWGQVASGIPTALGAKIESKLGGVQEYAGTEKYDSARKKLWQSMILPEAVRSARDKGIPLTEDDQVVDIARHLGIRPDQFTRDWPEYANQTDQERREFQAAQRERIQKAQPLMEEGAQRRQTASQVSERYRPNMGTGLGLKSIAFDTATMLPDLLAGTAATLATGPAGGAAFMAADIAPDEYSAARNEGLDHRHASTYAMLTTLASSVPEIPVFKILGSAPAAKKIIGGIVGEKFGATATGKVLGTSVAQGATQATVEALQEGIDEGLLDRHDTLPEALKKIAAAGLTGALAGAPMGGLHAAMHREPRPSALETAPGQAEPEAGAAAPGPSTEPEGEPSTSGNGAEAVNPEVNVPRATSEAPAQAEGAHPAQRPIPALIEPGQAPQTESVASGEEGVPAAQKGDLLPVMTPEEGAMGTLSGKELRDALDAVQKKTVSPPQLEALERMKLATRNDVNVPRLLPAGRRELTKALREKAAGPATEAEQPPVSEANIPPESAEKGQKPAETLPEVAISAPAAPIAVPKPAELSRNEPEAAGLATEVAEKKPSTIGNRLVEDQDLRASLTAMKAETGWAQEGGKLLRDATTDQAVGRTSWIPHADWWPGRPKGLKEQQIHAAVDKALAGKPLSKPEQRMVDFMTQVHDERTAMAQTHGELKEAVPELEEQPRATVDLTLLASRAGEHDANATAKIIDTWEDDRPETIARVQGELERIIGRGHQKEEFALERQGPGRVEPAAPQRTPAARDLFGEDRSKEQALADEQRRRDALRSPNRDVSVETGARGDLFSQTQRQVDFTDQLKAARAETHTEPSDGQKAAGNYAKGVLDFAGMKVAIENPKGSTRSGVNAQGEKWSREMAHDYGYVKTTEGKDGDAHDVFLTGKPDTGKVFVINQIDPATGRLDEHKSILGAKDAAEAERTYRDNYPKDWKGLGSIAEMPTEEFKRWVASDAATRIARPNDRAERRVDVEQRKKVSEMTAEQLRKELLTHELTQIPNRRAYVEAPKLPTQVSIDVDSLKAVNDVGGHHAGDELLKAVARVLHEETEQAYHLSGDEFAIQALHPREANEIMDRVANRLKDAEIVVSMPDGRALSLKGLGVSYGVGEDLAKADTALQAHKKAREAQGARAPRGEAPRGLTVRTDETGREDRGGAGPTEKEVGPKSRRAEAQTGLPRGQVERIVHQTVRDAHLAAGFPHVETHEDTSTLPEPIRELIARDGAENTTGAVYEPATGHIHLIASNNGSEREVRENLWHEAVGHHGLRMSMDGARYNAIMDGIYRDMPERVEAAATRNGLDLGDTEQRRAAAEEVIAYAAGQHLSGQSIYKPVLTWFKQAVRAVKAFFAKMAGKPFYDDKAIAGLIQQAQQALERGTAGTVPGEPVRSTRAPRFYSPVERAVEASKQGKASAEQWLATIKKMAGVKPEELEYLDLEPWLKSYKGPITKEELADYIRANRLEIEETVHGEEGARRTADEQAQTQLAEELRAEGHEVGFADDGSLLQINVRDPQAPGGWSLHDVNDREELEALPDTIRQRVDILNDISTRVAAERARVAEAPHGWAQIEGQSTQYGDYTLPGGKNYREMLLRMPEGYRGFELDKRKAIFDEYAERIDAQEKIARTYSLPMDQRMEATDAAIELREQRDTRADAAAPGQEPYRSTHWREKNILAHVRFNERTDADDKKVLFLEELQSDWHQQGRQRGYPQDVETIRAAQEKRDEAGRIAAAAMEELKRRMEAEKPSFDVQQEVLRTEAALRTAQADYDRAKGAVPDAPFKTSWPMLIQKRMIRFAAEHGFDRIAWTTGDQQNERYNLAKHVDQIAYWPNNDGTFRVQAAKNDGVVHSLHAATPDEIAEAYGQDIAQKIRDSVGTHDPAWMDSPHVLEGLDLSVGGEGMKGFYDTILPRETDKLIKKFGGKVVDSTVSGGSPQYNAELRKDEFQQVPVHGFTITNEMRQAALGQGFPLFARRQQALALQQPGPKGVYERIRKAVDWLMENPVTKDIRRLTSPANLSAESKQAARVASEYLGSQAAWGQRSQESLEHFSREIDKLPVQDQLDMMDRIEHGLPQAHPELQPAADGMRKMLDDWRDKVRGLGTGALDNFIENYFPHYWADPKNAKRMVASIQGRRPLKGPASFLKLRTIPTIKEGMDAGLKPLTVNPLVMTLLKTREMQRFITGVTLMKRFKEDGLAVFLASGRQMPDGWAAINDNSAKVRSWSDEESGWIERGQYIMPEDAARVINNHVSQSWLKSFAPAQAFRVTANLLNALQLGFSAFHLGFTTLDAIISKTALSMEHLLHGEFGKAASGFGEAALGPLAAVNNVRRGYRLLNAYTNPVGATPELAKIVKALEVAGGRAHMDKYYMLSEGANPFRGVGVRSLAKDIHSALTQPTDKIRNVGSAVGNFVPEYATKLLRGMQSLGKTHSALEIPFEVSGRLVRASTSWIMEHLVPMQKLGVFSDLAKAHIDRHPNENPAEFADSMQRIWASVDNRLGEMVYDNLFLNRTFKDILHFGIRAVGWNVGTVREIAGAPIDAMKAIDKAIRTGRITADDLGHKIPYVLAMTMTTAFYGAILNYLFTGEGPKEGKDYFFPRTGGETNYGTPQRISLPAYTKDVYEYSQRPGHTILNKLNPIFNVVGEMWQNEDFFGNPITDPDAGFWKSLGQRAQFVGKEATPFSLQGAQQLAGSEKPGLVGTVKRFGPYVGLSPAPGYVTSPDQMERRERSEREKKYASHLKYLMNKAVAKGDKEEIDRLRKEYVDAATNVKKTQVEVDKDKARSAVSRRKAATSMRQQGFPATANLVASLPLEPDAAARQYFREQAVA